MLSGVQWHCITVETAKQLFMTGKMKWKYEIPSIINKRDTRRVLNATPHISAHSLGSDNKKWEFFNPLLPKSDL